MRQLGTRARVAIGLLAGLAALGCAVWLLRPPPRVDMARYAPERTLAFVEVASAPALVAGLTDTEAWERLAGPLGLSSQLDLAGPVAEWLGRLDLGPDDAVALGRAQFALAVTGVEAGAEQGGADEAAIVVRPRFALVAKTHLGAGEARELAAERMPLVARRAYGDAVRVETGEYAGALYAVARPDEPGRQMVWAVVDDVVVVGNHEEAVRAVVDTALGRAPALAGDFYLARLRGEVRGHDAAVFAFFPQAGVGRLAGLGPAAVAGAVAGDPDRAATVARLFGGISEGAVRALAYGGSFEGGRFVDRYYTVLTPAVADAMRGAVRPAPGSAEELLALVPAGTREVTLLRVERPGEAFDAMLTAVSGRVDVGVAAALTQVAIEVRRGYGVEPGVAVSPMLGDAIAFVDFGDEGPVAAVFEARDAAGLRGVVERYLGADGARVAAEAEGGQEVLVSTHEDGRAAAFLGRHLVLGTREQIARVAAARAAGSRAAAPLAAALVAAPRAVLATQRDDRSEAAELMLALSRAVRASDGSAELLAEPAVADALGALPPGVSVTEVREDGLYAETRSAVGNLSYLTVLLGE